MGFISAQAHRFLRVFARLLNVRLVPVGLDFDDIDRNLSESFYSRKDFYENRIPLLFNSSVERT